MKLVEGLISRFEKLIDDNIASADNENMKKSWIYLKHHAYTTRELSFAIRRRAEGACEEERIKLWEDYYDKVVRLEGELHRVLDTYLYRTISRSIIVKF